MIRSAAKWTRLLLFAVGFLILGYCGADWMNSRMQQRAGDQELDRIFQNTPNTAARPQIAEGGLVGRVEIPRLHLSVVVFQGTDSKVLGRGVGHLDGSALPGEAGNVVLAAHRDTFFRSLRNIHQGDEITVTTEAGPRSYQVDSTQIVDPTDTGVAGPTARPTLTLITCYPFYYVGSAPKRFIVQAHDVVSMENEARNSRAKKETARVAYSKEQTPGRVAKPEETADLTYVFKASQ